MINKGERSYKCLYLSLKCHVNTTIVYIQRMFLFLIIKSLFTLEKKIFFACMTMSTMMRHISFLFRK